MGRKLYTTDQKQQLVRRACDEVHYKKRSRELYNFCYRKSIFFKSSIAIRISTIIFVLYLINFNGIFLSGWKEIISSTKIVELNVNGYTDSDANKNLDILTKTNNEYSIDYVKSKGNFFLVNDTIQVFKNIFGKITYISKVRNKHLNQIVKYTRCNNFLIFTLALTMFSFLLKDGYDILSRVFMKIVLSIDVVSILIYFIL